MLKLHVISIVKSYELIESYSVDPVGNHNFSSCLARLLLIPHQGVFEIRRPSEKHELMASELFLIQLKDQVAACHVPEELRKVVACL